MFQVRVSVKFETTRGLYAKPNGILHFRILPDHHAGSYACPNPLEAPLYHDTAGSELKEENLQFAVLRSRVLQTP
jgi:hypothetical protein